MIFESVIANVKLTQSQVFWLNLILDDWREANSNNLQFGLYKEAIRNLNLIQYEIGQSENRAEEDSKFNMF